MMDGLTFAAYQQRSDIEKRRGSSSQAHHESRTIQSNAPEQAKEQTSEIVVQHWQSGMLHTQNGSL
jgi:hypothetical protein